MINCCVFPMIYSRLGLSRTTQIASSSHLLCHQSSQSTFQKLIRFLLVCLFVFFFCIFLAVIVFGNLTFGISMKHLHKSHLLIRYSLFLIKLYYLFENNLICFLLAVRIHSVDFSTI